MVLRHNKVLHERNIVLHLVFVEEPWVGMDKRTTLQPFGNGFWRITMKFGFMNVPDVPRALPQIGRASCRERVCQYVSLSVVAVSFKNTNTRRKCPIPHL